MEPKQIIVVRKDLNMRKGKMCAQVAHASMKVIFDRMNPWETFDEDGIIIERILRLRPNSPMNIWIDGLFTKIVVSCDSEQELDELYQKALDKKLPCSMIIDAGLTEFNGIPTKTCIAIGPALPDKIDKITSHLKLL